MLRPKDLDRLINKEGLRRMQGFQERGKIIDFVGGLGCMGLGTEGIKWK